MQLALSPGVAGYIRLVIKSSTAVADPPEFLDRIRALQPCILAFWHGQFLLLPGFHPPDIAVRIMVARHDDAEGLAQVLPRFGLGLIRGAGAGVRRTDRGGAAAARAAIASLKNGVSVAMTADVPPGPARKAGLGIVTIASLSGRPIVPFTAATSRYRALNTWSRMTINLPWSRLAVVLGEPIFVPPAPSPEKLEIYRQRVEAALNAATAKAYSLAGADMARATPAPALAPVTDQYDETLFEPLTYATPSAASEAEPPAFKPSVNDIVLLGRCLALQDNRADISALRLELFQSADSWARLLSITEMCRLVAALDERLQARRLVPPESRDAAEGGNSPARVLRARVLTYQDRRRAQRERLVEMTTALNGAGMTPVLIKGARSLWTGIPDWRYQMDIDLLIEDAGAAQAVLLEMGYCP